MFLHRKGLHAQDAGASAAIIVTDEEELSPMSCAGDADVIIPVMQVLEADGRAMELGVRTGITLVSLEELKMPGAVDFVASTALLALGRRSPSRLERFGRFRTSTNRSTLSLKTVKRVIAEVPTAIMVGLKVWKSRSQARRILSCSLPSCSSSSSSRYAALGVHHD